MRNKPSHVVKDIIKKEEKKNKYVYEETYIQYKDVVSRKYNRKILYISNRETLN